MNKKNWNNMIKQLATIASLSVALCVQAQLEMGGWQTHFSYRSVEQLAQTNNKIYAVSSGNLFSVDKSYNSIEEYNKITGLSDGNIKQIEYNKENDILVICYEDLNIDIIKDGVTHKITDIATKEISGKSINNIAFNGKNIYFSCGFGIVVFNITKMEISSTYIIGDEGSYVSVLQTEFTADSIYALTATKLYAASINDKSLSNYQHWVNHSLPDSDPHTIVNFNNKINLFGKNWYYWDAYGWTASPYSYITNVTRAHTYGDRIVVVAPGSFASIYDTTYKETVVPGTVNDAVYDADKDLLWIAGDSLRVQDFSTSTTINSYLPAGPYSNKVSFMKFDQGRLLAGYGHSFKMQASIQQYDGNEWVNILYSDVENSGETHFYDVWDASYDPLDTRRLYVGTWWGLFEFYDNQFVKRYTDDETSLVAYSGTVQVENVIPTTDGYLWLTNTQAADVLKCRDDNGTWHTLSCSSTYDIGSTTGFIITKKNNFKVYVSDHYKSAGDACIHIVQSGSQPYYVGNQKTFSSFTISDGSTVTPTNIYCVAEDNNGELWVGTDVGPIIMKNLANVFSSNYTANRIKLTRKDDATLADYLLSGEQINTIAVDGANRKWIGTKNSGVYLLSEDGQETIHHFTKDDSPLTTNSIDKIAIDPNSGMVYIATPNGLFSYKSDAAEGKEDLNNVHVYPNPIRPNYSGDITITGLMEDTEVRITDMEGHVVSHGLSNGSVYTWDGMLANGHRASTGVYFVFQATQDGNNTNVTKFAIVKR